jgi:hypothetical protein
VVAHGGEATLSVAPAAGGRNHQVRTVFLLVRGLVRVRVRLFLSDPKKNSESVVLSLDFLSPIWIYLCTRLGLGFDPYLFLTVRVHDFFPDPQRIGRVLHFSFGFFGVFHSDPLESVIFLSYFFPKH